MRYRFLIFVFTILIGGIVCSCKENPSLRTGPSDLAYDTEQDPNDPQRTIPLQYQEAQGKRIFYDKCVWCHSDATPAGPSNRANLTPEPPLLNDGNVLNPLNNGVIQNIVTLGGSAVGKSPMMPPWGNTLSENDVRDVIAYVRRIAQPPYQAPAQTSSDYGVK